KAGTGDVLAGMAGALLAQGLNAYDACVLAVYLHAAAGRIAAEQYTEIAAVPEDLIEVLPEAIWNLAKN
ncbi:MAG: NAD(P)H-hydrate dehydratase, partial [Eggerthellaceae bacterium]